MRRVALTSAIAFCVVAGFILGEFVRAIRPVDYLLRPLILAVGFAIAIGLAASAFGRWSIPVAVFGAAWLVHPSGSVPAGVAIVVAALVAYRLWTRNPPRADSPLIAAAVMFMVAGILPVIPLSTQSFDDRPAASIDEGPPQYAILLDGYPRADTLATAGIDVSPFLEALEDRGFEHYPNATTNYYRTFQTITEMTGGSGADYVESIEQQRRIREKWKLPEGWVTVAPPIGVVTLPNETVLNPGALNRFEVSLIARSALGPFAGNWILDRLRIDINKSLDILASTSEQRVFAHFLAPHTPFLYGAEGEATRASGCWPHCRTTGETGAKGNNLEPFGYYAQWLNGRLLEVVDEILIRRPHAEIVLFSDHGSRVGDEESEEWYRVFFAARTPSRPHLFSDSAHPRQVFAKLQAHGIAVRTEGQAPPGDT